MNRPSPVDLRNAIAAANALTKAGILFVAIPVLNDADHASLVIQANARLDTLAEIADGGAQ